MLRQIKESHLRNWLIHCNLTIERLESKKELTSDEMIQLQQVKIAVAKAEEEKSHSELVARLKRFDSTIAMQRAEVNRLRRKMNRGAFYITSPFKSKRDAEEGYKVWLADRIQTHDEPYYRALEELKARVVEEFGEENVKQNGLLQYFNVPTE